MSYTKNTWQIGDTVTAEKLNHMEDGIAAASGSSGGGVLTVHEGEGRALDKTWQEIYDAGFSVLELSIAGKLYGVLAQIGEYDEDYEVVFVTLGDSLRPQAYVTNSANGYPVYTESP